MTDLSTGEPMSLDVVRNGLRDSASALAQLLANEEALGAIVSAGTLITDALQSGKRIYSCGNGGSMCDAMHFAEELSGRYRDDRPGYAALAISDPSHLSCVGNDYGYERVFSRFIEAHGQAGDVLLAISTSGGSANVIAAVKAARERGLKVVGLTGRAETALTRDSDVAIVTPAGRYADRVQELHIKVIHLLIELTERALAPQNYAAAADH